MTRVPRQLRTVDPEQPSAASYLSPAGTSKMICGAAFTVSQAFCAISLSSWPAPHPEYPA